MNAQNEHPVGSRSSTRSKPTSPQARTKTAWRIALCLLTWAGSLDLAHAATSVCGLVGGTWTSNDSPYLVTCDVAVTNLTIEPGVEIRFQGPYVFEVQGVLQAQGTLSSPIVFTNGAGVVGWNGIYFHDNSIPSSLTSCQIYGSTNSGIRIRNTTPAISHCVIANNSAPLSGGGIQASLSSGTIFISRCIITNNIISAEVAYDEGGGGIWINGNAEIDDCYIAGNIFPWGAGDHPGGAGVQCRGGSTVLRRSTIVGNQSARHGGGLAVMTLGYARLFNCLVASNSIPPGSYLYGAGIAVHGSATGADVVNCTIVWNSKHGIFNGSLCNVTNSIVYFNNSEGAQIELYTAGQPGNVEYSDIQNGWPGTGNITNNPVVHPVTLFLQPGSPCIDAGNPDPVFNDVCLAPCGLSLGTVTNDMGAYGGPGACGWSSPCCPMITAQPQDQVGCLSHSATFTVKATGSGSLSYQWYFNTNTLITNATSASLTLTNLQGTNAGSYSVVVSSQYCSTNSRFAQLTLYDPYTELEVEWYFDTYMFAGLNIAGRPGATYVLKYTTNLLNTDWSTWTPLTTNKMGSSGWFFYLDEESLDSPTRFYGAKLKP